jgi:hypothetical protein
MIDNPEHVDDPMLYKQPPIKYVGSELWQVKSVSLDNIITESLRRPCDACEGHKQEQGR